MCLNIYNRIHGHTLESIFSRVHCLLCVISSKENWAINAHIESSIERWCMYPDIISEEGLLQVSMCMKILDAKPS